MPSRFWTMEGELRPGSGCFPITPFSWNGLKIFQSLGNGCSALRWFPNGLSNYRYVLFYIVSKEREENRTWSPRFQELSVYKVWPLITWVYKLMIYFPDYSSNQIPERTYMYIILTSFRYEKVKEKVKNERNNRALQNPDNDRMVYF